MSSPSIYCVIGDDDFTIRQKAQKFLINYVPNSYDELSREVIDGRADRVEDAERILKEAKLAAGTVSLFGGGNSFG